MNKKYENWRLNFYLFSIFLAAFYISYNIFILTYFKHQFYLRTARAQNENISNVLARGNIYLKEHLAATNKKFPLAYIVPSEINIQESQRISEIISSILNIDSRKIQDIINYQSNKNIVLLRKLNDQQVIEIKKIGIKGLGVTYETDRFYPGGSLAANVIGFLGYNGNQKSGQYGIEAFYDDELVGKKWGLSNYFSAYNFTNYLLKFINNSKKEDNDETIDRPADIVLTIDKNIQQLAEDKLEFLMNKWRAVKGSIIIQDPNTGAILAMADRPTFNPNNYYDYEPSTFLNQGIQEIFEPGSSFKPITMAMGLDLGVLNPQTEFEDIGYRNEAGYTIKNFNGRVFGKVTMSQVLEKSINTGAMYVQDLVGNEKFLDYVINFGFGQKTGIDLPGEASGNITNLYSNKKINFLTASFGQGIAVTPIQLINAYSAIANGGKLMKPYVVEKIIKDKGEEIQTKPEIVSIPITEKTSFKLKSMLVSVVDNGFDKARIIGYDVAGKTGTAQISGGRSGYLENEYIHDFLGFAPAFEPKFTILIKIERPKGVTFAADSLSPTFKEITQFLLNYYNIPPTRK
jgi:cell division protein FtsI/penicillin-binding protein 2